MATASRDGTTRLWNTSKEKEAEVCRLIPLRDGDWIVVAPDGRFDAGSLEGLHGLYRSMPDDPSKPLPLEIFMRDYYEPRLLPRLLKGESLPIRPLAELNRLQPEVEAVTVVPRAGDTELVDVKVKVSSVPGRRLKGNEHMPCESGVHDLRLYRDGQSIQRSPAPTQEPAAQEMGENRREEQLLLWRKRGAVKTSDGRPVTVLNGAHEVTFTCVHLPRRSDVSRVEFTAYAFNKDRVKSVTGAPAPHRLRWPRPSAKRRAYIITVGVDVTSDPSLRLSFAPNGARESRVC